MTSRSWRKSRQRHKMRTEKQSEEIKRVHVVGKYQNGSRDLSDTKESCSIDEESKLSACRSGLLLVMRDQTYTGDVMLKLLIFSSPLGIHFILLTTEIQALIGRLCCSLMQPQPHEQTTHLNFLHRILKANVDS